MSAASQHTTRPAYRRLAVSLGLAAAVAMPPAALAQIEEIVVTVRQRAETIRDVPGAVTVLGAGQIEASGVQRVDDFIALTPGVTLVNAAEVADTQVNIRGINGARDAENSFALIIDGILMTNPAAVNREYTNLQQIEILKGPQGALYGRNAAAGAIVVTTRPPGDELAGNIKLSLAQDNSWLFAGDIGGPVNDQLRWSINADYRQSDGFYRNEFLGRSDVVDYFEGWNVGGRLIWEPSDRLTVDAKFRYGEVDAASITFNSVFHLPGLVDLLEQGFGFPADFAATAYQNVNTHQFQFNPNIIPFNEQEALELSLKVDYDLGFATLTSWALYSAIDNELGADGTSAAFQFFAGEQNCIDSTEEIALSGFTLAPPQILVPQGAFGPGTGGPLDSIYGAYTPTTCDGTQYQVRNQGDFSFETRLSSNEDGGPLSWSAGLYYLNIDREVGVNTAVDTGNGIIRALYTNDPLNPTEQLVWDQFDTDVYAVFGSLGYDLSDTVAASLAMRYDIERRKVRSKVPAGPQTQFIQTCPDPGTQGSPLNPGLCDGPIDSQRKTFRQLQPKGSLTWDFLPDWTAFATVGVGFKSGGFNNSGSAATIDSFLNEPLMTGPGAPFSEFAPAIIPDQFDKETSLAYEIGVKAELLERRLRGEISLFRTEVDDMQFFEFFVGPFGLLRVVSNVDEVVIQGVEFGATWMATDWLDLYAGASFLDSDIKQNSARPDTVGNKSPYTADWTANAGGRITWPLPAAPQINLLASVDVNAVGDTYFHVVQGQERPTGFSAAFGIDPAEYSVAKRDDYTLVNARLGFGGDAWSVVVFAKNLFDKSYLEEVITAPEFGGSFIHPGSERRIGIEGNYRF